jgi:hypothetical protein
LFFIRFLAIIVFVTVLVNPEFAHEKTIRPGKPVLLLVDVSSDTVLPGTDKDAQKTAVLGIYRAVLRDLEDLGFKTKVYFFAEGLFAVNGPGLPFNAIHETVLSESSFAEVLGEIAEADKPGAVIVISDGIQGEVRKTSFPIFAFSVAPEPVLGFYPVSARVPRYVLSGTRFPIEMTFAGSGDRPFDYSIYEGDKKVLSGRGSPDRYAYIFAPDTRIRIPLFSRGQLLRTGR